MHSVTDRQTDGQTCDMMMPIADHTLIKPNTEKRIRKQHK